MFSGKTTRLIQIYKTRTYIGKKVAVINYAEDTRYHETLMSTHDQMMIPCIQIKDLRTLYASTDTSVEEADTILINEGQFFQDICLTVLEWVEKKGKEVFICGLDGDFLRNTFGDLLSLIPFCDTVEKLSSLCAHCRDGTPAIFSHRITQEIGQKVIGSSNYMPLCRKCYIKESAHPLYPKSHF
jgi:thymidine kinase